MLLSCQAPRPSVKIGAGPRPTKMYRKVTAGAQKRLDQMGAIYHEHLVQILAEGELDFHLEILKVHCAKDLYYIDLKQLCISYIISLSHDFWQLLFYYLLFKQKLILVCPPLFCDNFFYYFLFRTKTYICVIDSYVVRNNISAGSDKNCKTSQ